MNIEAPELASNEVSSLSAPTDLRITDLGRHDEAHR